jgi:hypothetical protein
MAGSNPVSAVLLILITILGMSEISIAADNMVTNKNQFLPSVYS